MLSHKPLNKWQTGLLDLFGYMDALKWTLLWTLAEFSDDDGNSELRDKDITYALVRDRQRIAESTKSTLKRIQHDGLVKVVARRKNRMEQQPNGRWHRILVHPRIIQLYAGIQYGKIPPGANRVDGLVPMWHYKGRNCVWQTHKLFRGKFKATKHPPRYEDYSHLTDRQKRALIPSPSQRRKYERERVKQQYERQVKRRHSLALNFFYY